MEIFEGGLRNFLRKVYGNTERYSLDTTGDSKHRSGDGDEPLGRFYVELQTVPPYLIYFQSSQSVSIFPSFPPFSLLLVTAHSVISPGCFLMERSSQGIR